MLPAAATLVAALLALTPNFRSAILLRTEAPPRPALLRPPAARHTARTTAQPHYTWLRMDHNTAQHSTPRPPGHSQHHGTGAFDDGGHASAAPALRATHAAAARVTTPPPTSTATSCCRYDYKLSTKAPAPAAKPEYSMKHAIHLTAAAASALLVPRYPHLATILLVSSLPEPADAGRAGKGKKKFYAIHGGQNAGIYDEYNNNLANHQSVDHKWFETYEDALAFVLGEYIRPEGGTRFPYQHLTTPIVWDCTNFIDPGPMGVHQYDSMHLDQLSSAPAAAGGEDDAPAAKRARAEGSSSSTAFSPNTHAHSAPLALPPPTAPPAHTEGDRVVIIGTSQSTLNGRLATVSRFDEQTERYIVAVDGIGLKSLRPANLAAASAPMVSPTHPTLCPFQTNT